ncbi:MAG: autotransporter outer membrane beta-barrel domain-containing protein [Rickettsiales bacterium]|nr:autotransporter outer membrane beta-barrel domain-containing protein [Rickettsiales bacterium]
MRVYKKFTISSSLLLKFVSLLVFLPYNSTALGKGIEIRYYELGKIGYAGSSLIYDRRISPSKDADIAPAVQNDLTRYYMYNPRGETYSDWVKAEDAKALGKFNKVFKVCVVDTSVGHYKWFVNETGEEIITDPQPARRSSIVELAEGTIAKLSTTPIEVLQAASMTSTATTPLFPVVISSSKHNSLETLSPEQDKAVASLDHSEIEMLKGGVSDPKAAELIRLDKSPSDVAVLRSLSVTTPLFPVVISSSKHNSLETLSSEQVKAVVSLDHLEIEMLKGGVSDPEADELIRRGKSPSDVAALRSLSVEQVKAITKFIPAVEDAVQKASTADGSSPKIYIVKKPSKSKLKGDPTSDSYVKTLSKNQKEELYQQTLENISNNMIAGGGGGNGGGGTPPDPIEEIKGQKPIDFKENKFEIYDELMLIATDPTNSRISELITPLHGNFYGIAAGEDAINAKQKSVWVRGLYGFINQGQELEQMGFKGHNHGGTVGVDANITEDSLIGISYTRMFANFKYKIGPGNKATTTSDVFSLYGISELTNDFILQGLASVGKIQVKQQTQRKIDINRFRTVYGSFDVDSYSAEAVLNYKVPNLQKYYLMPNIGLRFSKSYDEGYEETNAGLFNRKTSPTSYTSWLLLAGIKAGVNYNLSENFSLTPGVHTQVGKYINSKANDNQVARVLEAVIANVPVKSRGTAYNIGSTLRIDYKNKAEILFSYNAHLIGKYRSHQGSLSFKYFF